MKTLLVFRHGKSDWNADYGEDHDRPLARRGIDAARTMGRWLARIEQVPDRVVTSSAARARETVKLAAAAGAWPVRVDVRPELYEASPAGILELLREVPDGAESLLVAGHEPTCSRLVAKLTGGSDVKFPTASLARIDLPVARWADAAFGDGTLVWLVAPRLFRKIRI